MENKKVNAMHFIYSFVQGGTEKLLIYFLKACKEEVTFVIMGNQVDEYLRQEILKTGHKICFLNKKRGERRFKYLISLLKIIKENNINIIHTHDFGSMMWSIICKIIKPKLKLVYTIHDSVILKNWKKFTFFLNRNFMGMNIAISEAILSECIVNNLKATKVYNGVDTKKWKQSQGGTGTFCIINVARITYYKKGLDVLIKALKECKDRGLKFTCSLVGGTIESDENSMEYLKKLIDDLDISEEINFLGNREDVPELLAQSDLFILPSRFEGLPVSLLEAMSAKLPVIASNISGSADLIEHEKNGLLFESENHSDLAEKIMYLYNNKEEMERIAQSGHKYAQGFDISVMCEKYWDVYKSLIK